MQEREFQLNERKIVIDQNSNQENVLSINHENKESSYQCKHLCYSQIRK